MGTDGNARREPDGIGAFFDDYVARVFPARREEAGAAWRFPGDEWVDDAMRAATWRFVAGGEEPRSWQEVIEIGPGSGKYTAMLLAAGCGHVTAYEISRGFLASLDERCAVERAEGRLDARLIDWADNRALLRDYGSRCGTADLLLAIDVFLMMDFQSVLVYLLSATAMLRAGGRLVATFGDAGSASGWQRMLRDAGRHSAFDAAPSTRFHWIDAAILRDVLDRLGFGAIEIAHGPDGGLDIARLYVSARLEQPADVATIAAILAPAGGSTNRADG